MTTTVEAICQDSKLVLCHPLSLPEKSRVRVTIESDPEREAWINNKATSQGSSHLGGRQLCSAVFFPDDPTFTPD